MARVRFLDQVPVGFYDVDNNGGGSTPGGPFSSIQYNDAGTLNGDSNLLWDNNTDTVLLNGKIIATSFTGSLFGTSSFATSASQAVTASYVQTAQTASYVLSASYALSSSQAQTASYVLNAVSASYALSTSQAQTASYVNPLNQDVIITGSLNNGLNNIATGQYSHAEGGNTEANGLYSHAEGQGTIASGSYSHAEGVSTIAYGISSHAEGVGTISSGSFSHTEGGNSIAYGNQSHAEGANNTTYGEASHAEGYNTITYGEASHAEGIGTITSASYQHAQGAYNITSSIPSAFILGNGTDNINRSNLIFAAGNQVEITGSLNTSGSIFFPTLVTSSIAVSNVVMYGTNGQLFITASSAIGGGGGISGDYVTTASFNAYTGSSISQFAGTSSFATTASYVLNAVSASYALSSSQAQTASYVVIAQTASYVLNAVSASYALSSSQAQTASSILGGKATHVPYFITDTTLATSSIYQSGSTTVIINQDNATTANPEALYVYQPSTTSFNVISGKGNLNNYLQLNIQNTNQGISASSDVVATANNGNESTNYIDMGINSENYSQNFIGAANDAYLYSTGNHLHIGNASNFPVQIFAGGSDVDVYNKLELSPNNQHIMSGSLDVSGSIKAFSFTGSLQGNATTATTAQTSSYSTTLGASLSQPANNQVRLLNSAGGTLSTATVDNVTSASYADNASNATYAATAGNGGVTQIIAGSGISLIPSSGQGAVTVISTGGGGVTIISGSLVTGSFTNTTSFTFNHNLSTRTPIITVFDSNYNQIIPQNIELVNTASATITFPTPESGFAIGSTGGTTGTALSSSYALFATYADTASFYAETDPVFVAKSASLATTGSNVFRGNQTVTGSLFTSGSNTLIGDTTLSGSLNISGSQTFYGTSTSTGTQIVTGSLLTSGSQTLIGTTTLSGSINVSGSTTLNGTTNFYGTHTLSGSNTILGNTTLSGSLEVSGSSNFHNSIFTVTGSTYIKGVTNISGSTNITGSFNVTDGDINIVSGSSFTRWGNKLFNYGQFSSTVTQSGSANTAYSMNFDTTDSALNVNIVSGSRITVDNTGIYNLQFSAQLGNTANSTVDFDIWFAYTGSNLANSNTNVTLNKVAGSTGRTVAAWNFMTPIAANDYIEIKWSCNASTGEIQAQGTQTGPARPAIPSVIATLTQIA